MSYEQHGKDYRTYALLQGIHLLINMVEQIRDDKVKLQDIYGFWIDSGILQLKDQIDLIFGTAADKIKCRYMVFCINQLNSYLLSKHPNHRGLIVSLSKDVLNSINMAVMGSAHIWSRAQLDAIQAAFKSSHVAKPTPYYESPEKEEEKKKKKKKKKIEVLEYKEDLY